MHNSIFFSLYFFLFLSHTFLLACCSFLRFFMLATCITIICWFTRKNSFVVVSGIQGPEKVISNNHIPSAMLKCCSTITEQTEHKFGWQPQYIVYVSVRRAAKTHEKKNQNCDSFAKTEKSFVISCHLLCAFLRLFITIAACLHSILWGKSSNVQITI